MTRPFRGIGRPGTGLFEAWPRRGLFEALEDQCRAISRHWMAKDGSLQAMASQGQAISRRWKAKATLLRPWPEIFCLRYPRGSQQSSRSCCYQQNTITSVNTALMHCWWSHECLDIGTFISNKCSLQSFESVGWAVGRASGLQKN